MAAVFATLVALTAHNIRRCWRQRQVTRQEVVVVPTPVVTQGGAPHRSLANASAPPPLSSEERQRVDHLESARITALQGLPRSVWDGGATGDVCVLCIDAYSNGDLLRRLPCNHSFHAGCIDHWLIRGLAHQKRSCPLCKADPIADLVCMKPNPDAVGGTSTPRSVLPDPGTGAPQIPPPPISPLTSPRRRIALEGSPMINSAARRLLGAAASVASSSIPWGRGTSARTLVLPEAMEPPAPSPPSQPLPPPQAGSDTVQADPGSRGANPIPRIPNHEGMTIIRIE